MGRLLAGVAALGPLLSACGSNGATAGPVATPDSSIAGDSTSPHSDASPTGDAASPLSDAAMDAALGDAAPSEAGAGDGGPIAPPGCNPGAQWGTGTLLAISTPDFDRFGAITPDERTIAWTTPAASDAGAGGTVHYADRASASDPFGTPQTMGPAAGYFALDQVALSPDGLGLVVVRADHQGFGSASRASRSAAFGSPDETPFSAVNLNHVDIPMQGVVQADPVFAQDGTSLFFTEYGSTTVNPIMFVDLLSGLWSTFRPVVAGALSANSGKLRRPTGLSADRRTLFFFDEVAGIERAAWRDSADGLFAQFADVGALSYAQPNAACNRLYYSAQGASSVDLFYADAK